MKLIQIHSVHLELARICERPCSLHIYSSPLADVARAHGVKCQLYADDDKLWISFRPADGTSWHLSVAH